MKKLWGIVILTVICNLSFAQENKVYLKDNNIIVESKEGLKALDYSRKDKYRDYNLQKWEVKRDSNKISDVLSVYKNKGKSQYLQKLWFIDKNNGENTTIIEYKTADENEKMLFTQDENYVFYLGLSPDSDTVLFGLNLLTGNQFTLASASDFTLGTCPNKRNYVIIQKNEEDEIVYHVYNLNGDKIDSLTTPMTFEDVEKHVCY